MSLSFRTYLIILTVALSCSTGFAQSNSDNRTSVFDGPEKDEPPKSLKEQLVKMQIQKEKKDHGEMVARAEETFKLSTELETSYAERGALTNKDVAKLERVEKLVKKIRSDLGGNEDDSSDEESLIQRNDKSFLAAAIDSLKSTTSTLLAELKKTSRFTISAAAITTSNTLLRITRILRFRN